MQRATIGNEAQRAVDGDPTGLRGRVVDGKWRLESAIGKGSFGEVWVAHHVVTGRCKALKLLDPWFTTMPEQVERFVREARAAARVDSPHVVSIDDIGTDLELQRAYLVMELLRGESLYAYLSRAPYAMPWAQTLCVLQQMASALDAAHAVGVVHRDLKPENVFLSWSEEGEARVTVLDFGIAKLIDASECDRTSGLRRVRTMGFLGTPGYAGPEQIRDAGTVTHVADVFALGICAYEMLTGRSYWRAASDTGMLAEILEGVLEPPSRRAPTELSLPAGFDAWFLRACARDPAERFQSAGEAVLALQHALGWRGPLPSPVPRGRPHTGPRAEEPTDAPPRAADEPVTLDADSSRPRPALPRASRPVARALGIALLLTTLVAARPVSAPERPASHPSAAPIARALETAAAEAHAERPRPALEQARGSREEARPASAPSGRVRSAPSWRRTRHVARARGAPDAAWLEYEPPGL
jgi:serine/threonine-protein kinase